MCKCKINVVKKSNVLTAQIYEVYKTKICIKLCEKDKTSNEMHVKCDLTE